MSFAVEMPADQFSVEAGSTVPLSFAVTNSGSASEQLEISLEGLDSDWTAIPVPTVSVDPSERQTQKVFLKPPRISESQAGDYPFALKVRSLESGEAKTLQAILTIKPFQYLSMEISPKRGVFSPTKKENDFSVTVMNLGNSDQSLQLFANDPEDELIYAYEQEQITLGPGQTKSVSLTVVPSRSKLLSSARLHGFSVGARSIDTPSLTCHSQAQLEQRAMLSPANFALVLVLFSLFLGWLALLPKPPTMDTFHLSKAQVFAGDLVTIRWQASNASRVRILLGSETLVDSPDTLGSEEFVARSSGTLQAFAVRDGKTSDPLSTTLTVTDRPVVPPPKIDSFTISPRDANKGDTLTVKYHVSSNTTKITLSPPGQVLDPNIETIFLNADVVGTISYTLVAENSEGRTAKETVTVVVKDPTLPQILEFKATPGVIEADIGTVTLTWNTRNVERIELRSGNEKLEPTAAIGTIDVPISATTEFSLIAYDNQGRKETKKIKVEVKPSPVIDPSRDPASTTGGQPTGGQ